MNNLYVIANQTLDRFRKADGSWTGVIDEAEQMGLHAALEKEIEVHMGGEKLIQLFEVPLMHDAQYEDALSLSDAAAGFFDRHGIDLSVEIASGDETTWTMKSRGSGETVTVTLADCDSFEVSE
jgi:hypothetical protein